jgi:hypothetical protein
VYSYVYEPYLINTWTLAAFAALEIPEQHISRSVDCYNWPGDDLIDLPALPNLNSLRVCAFDDIYRIQHALPGSKMSSLIWKEEALAREVKQIFTSNHELSHLHIISHKVIGGLMTQHIRWDASVLTFIRSCGSAISDSAVTSIALEGMFLHSGMWEGWQSCFDRLLSFSCSHGYTIKTITEKFPASFQHVTEMRLSILHHDFASGHVNYFWPGKNYTLTPLQHPALSCHSPIADHGASFHALMRIFEYQNLRHLSLCGFDKVVLLHALKSNGPTLESLRFYVQKECCVPDLCSNDLALIRQSCPVLAWIGITIQWTDLISPIYSSKSDGTVQPTGFLDALTEFEALQTISCFISGLQGKDWSLNNFEFVDVYYKLRLNKRGKALTSMRFDCNNHVWKLTELSPSKLLVRSFSRDHPEKGYSLELWDLTECMPEYSEVVPAHVEPEYEWGLTKWELHHDKIGIYAPDEREFKEFVEQHGDPEWNKKHAVIAELRARQLQILSDVLGATRQEYFLQRVRRRRYPHWWSCI